MMAPNMARSATSLAGGSASCEKCRTKRGVISCRPPPGGPHAASSTVSSTSFQNSFLRSYRPLMRATANKSKYSVSRRRRTSHKPREGALGRPNDAPTTPTNFATTPPEVLEVPQQLDGRLRAAGWLPAGHADVVHEQQETPARGRAVAPLALLLQPRLQGCLGGGGAGLRAEEERHGQRTRGGLPGGEERVLPDVGYVKEALGQVTRPWRLKLDTCA